VAALQGRKIISIATGSLHCVACTDNGEVFTWGDNDEGQLGDGSTNAIQRPRLVASLQNRKINRVACGSAHTLAWSTNKPVASSRLPVLVPIEYDMLKDIPLATLRNRLVFLHHFSDLFCPGIAMFPLGTASTTTTSTGGNQPEPAHGMDKLRTLLVSASKEAAFRKVVQATMIRDRQHGPVLELNRFGIKRSRKHSCSNNNNNNNNNNSSSTSNAGNACNSHNTSSSNNNNIGEGVGAGGRTVFAQMVSKMGLLNNECLLLPHRVWKVKFVGESVDDCGGGYSESIAEMCDELTTAAGGQLSLLIPTPNGRDESGTSRDCFLLNPTLRSVHHMQMFHFLGLLMGVAIRTGAPLSLNLAEPMWKLLSGSGLSTKDITEVDRDYMPGLVCIRDMDGDSKAFAAMDMSFSTPSAAGHEVLLSNRYRRVTAENRAEYVRLALNFRNGFLHGKMLTCYPLKTFWAVSWLSLGNRKKKAPKKKSNNWY
jgi:E3 ubiquitin-protein ligase HERC2